MTLAHLTFCTASIYASFLLWALLQERLTTTPYTLPLSWKHPASTERRNEYFKSPLVLNALQAIACTVVAVVYLVVRSRKSSEPLSARLGLDALTPAGAQRLRKPSSYAEAAARPTKAKSAPANGASQATEKPTQRVSPLLLRYVQIAASQSISSLLALHSLSHGISYPTLTLAKSCKLVPVLMANVLLYRRKFAAYKYVVVLLVTVGISTFMLFGEGSKKKKASNDDRSSLIGLLLLLGNQALDGITNSTQDEVFGTYSLSGPKMMLIMNAISALLMSTSLLVPVPTFLGGKASSGNELGELARAVAFVQRHPEVLRDMLGYAIAGAVGQIAIFETLERFGSLTLVAITVTRKLFTMLLSIVVYKHTLKPAQWLGVAIVFVGLGIEAREKQREGVAKRILAEKRAAVKDA